MLIDRDTIEVSDDQLHDANLVVVCVPFMAQNFAVYSEVRYIGFHVISIIVWMA